MANPTLYAHFTEKPIVYHRKASNAKHLARKTTYPSRYTEHVVLRNATVKAKSQVPLINVAQFDETVHRARRPRTLTDPTNLSPVCPEQGQGEEFSLLGTFSTQVLGKPDSKLIFLLKMVQAGQTLANGKGVAHQLA